MNGQGHPARPRARCGEEESRVRGRGERPEDKAERYSLSARCRQVCIAVGKMGDFPAPSDTGPGPTARRRTLKMLERNKKTRLRQIGKRVLKHHQRRIRWMMSPVDGAAVRTTRRLRPFTDRAIKPLDRFACTDNCQSCRLPLMPACRFIGGA